MGVDARSLRDINRLALGGDGPRRDITVAAAKTTRKSRTTGCQLGVIALFCGGFLTELVIWGRLDSSAGSSLHCQRLVYLVTDYVQRALGTVRTVRYSGNLRVPASAANDDG